MTRMRIVVAGGTAGLLLASVGNAAATAPADVLCDGLPATIIGTDGDDTIVGTEGNDVIAGLDGWDTIYGGAGEDVICSGDKAGPTYMYGEDGDDVLLISTPGIVDGGHGRDRIESFVVRSGQVDLTFVGATQALHVNLQNGTARGMGKDTVAGVSDVWGTEFDDHITGDGTANLLFGQGGNDTLQGLGGKDGLFGADGEDTLEGGKMFDVLSGAAGDDTYAGGAGDDVLQELSDVSNDTMMGGAGDDRLLGGPGVDVGDGGPDIDDCVDIETATNCEN